MFHDAIPVALRSLRGPAIWALFTLFLFSLAGVLSDCFAVLRANAAIHALVSHKDIPIEPGRAPAQEILARINADLWLDDINAAETLLSNPSASLPAETRALALYNIANARTIRGAALAEKGDTDGATALVSVAKAEYRAALRLLPDNWDLKFNLDVAMRIVRDLPLEQNPDSKAPDARKKLWTDLPGVPRGLP